MADKKTYKRAFMTWFSQIVTGVVFTGLYYVAPDKTEPVEYAKLALGLLSSAIGITYFLIPKVTIQDGEVEIFQTIFTKKIMSLRDITKIETPSSKQDLEINGTLFHFRDISKEDFNDLEDTLRNC